jgi:hypothetical protein
VPVSWLLVWFIPGLLMLATFGLQRLESSLNHESVGASDVAEFLAQAQPIDMRTLAREGMPEALDCFHRRRMSRIEPSREVANYSQRAYTRPNPQFRTTRHADSV